MIGEILCWLGFHKWARKIDKFEYDGSGFYIDGFKPMGKVIDEHTACLRCGKRREL